MSQSLMEFFQTTYLARHWDLTPGARHQYEVVIRLFEQSRGGVALCRDLTPSNLAQFLLWLRQNGRGPVTINKKRSALLTIWRAAAKCGLCLRPIDDELPDRAREYRRQPVAWTLHELEQLLKVSSRLPGDMRNSGIPRAEWWTSLILFLYDSGVRISAALAVSPGDMDLVARRVVLRSESSKTRLEQHCSISEQTAESIEAHLDPRRDRVWPWGRHQNELWSGLRSILMKAGLPSDRRCLFHRLRRTTASHMAKATSIAAAQRQLGHTSEQMTRRYIDPRFVANVDAAHVLPRPLIK